jgi:hypothetical protein
MIIRMALTLMLASGGISHVVDVKGAFCYGKFDDGEKIYIKVPLGFEEFYDDNTVLLLPCFAISIVIRGYIPSSLP